MRCTHQPSPWIGDYGFFLVQPHTTENPDPLDFSVASSTFLPYLFNASLEQIVMELTATSHAAVMRVTFPENHTGFLSLMIGHGAVNVEDQAITGHTTDNNGGVPPHWRGMFFVMKVISPSTSMLTPSTSMLKSSGVAGARATLAFPANSGSVVVALATSFISGEQAQLNLQREVGSKTFDQVMEEGRAEWNSRLRSVEVDSMDDIQLRVFYTNLWRSMLFPRYLQEVNAEGEEVHFSPYKNAVLPGKLVTDSGFWDAYRTVYVLQSILSPDNLGSLVDGWVTAFEEASWLPQWPSPGMRDSMVGTMGDCVLGDAIAKSEWGFVGGFNVTRAYEAIRKDAFVAAEGLFGRTGLDDYVQKGYVPESEFKRPKASLGAAAKAAGQSESVTRTLDYSIADAVIARAATLLGRDDDHDVLEARSKRYGVLFNNDSLFFQPRNASGSFLTPFDPLAWKNGFTESGGWQYRFYVPHDVEGLKALYRGELCGRVEAMLTQTTGPAFHVGGYGGVIHEMKELAAIQADFGLYAHNNQPVHHVLWVAQKAGCNEVAETYLRRVVSKLYTTRGWAGDEDNGEMASWYVLSALGLYSLEGAKDELVIGSPAVVGAVVRLPRGRVLQVTVENQAKDNVRVQSVTWTPTGGLPRAVTSNTLRYTELMGGGTLAFTMVSSASATSRSAIYV
jgi:predicted alpha-1,2-mannosidase